MTTHRLLPKLGLGLALALGVTSCGTQQPEQQRKTTAIGIDTPEFKKSSEDLVGKQVNTLDAQTLSLVDSTKLDQASADMIKNLKVAAKSRGISDDKVNAISDEIPGFLRSLHRKDTTGSAEILRKMARIAYPDEASVQRKADKKQLGLGWFDGLWGAGWNLASASLNFIGAVANAGVAVVSGVAQAGAAVVSGAAQVGAAVVSGVAEAGAAVVYGVAEAGANVVGAVAEGAINAAGTFVETVAEALDD